MSPVRLRNAKTNYGARALIGVGRNPHSGECGYKNECGYANESGHWVEGDFDALAPAQENPHSGEFSYVAAFARMRMSLIGELSHLRLRTGRARSASRDNTFAAARVHSASEIPG